MDEALAFSFHEVLPAERTTTELRPLVTTDAERCGFEKFYDAVLTG